MPHNSDFFVFTAMIFVALCVGMIGAVGGSPQKIPHLAGIDILTHPIYPIRFPGADLREFRKRDIGSATPYMPGFDAIGDSIDPLTMQYGINVFNASKMCLTPDSAYLIPCGINVIPILDTNVQMDSSIYTSSSSYTSLGTTSVSVSGSASYGLASVSAKYSYDASKYVQDSYYNQATLATAEASMELYQLTLQNTVYPLSDELLNIIQILYDARKIGDSSTYNTWMYQLCNGLKAAIITTVVTGGKLQQMYYVDNTYISSTDINTVKGCVSASAKFSSLFNINGQYSWGVSQEQVSTFSSEVTQSTFNVVGGQYIINMSMAQWQETVLQQPATLSIIATPSNIILNPEILKNYGFTNKSITQAIYDDYTASISGYLGNNTYAGCTDFFAVNFNMTASVDNGECVYEAANASPFGSYYVQEGYCDVAGFAGFSGCESPIEYSNFANGFANTLSCPNFITPYSYSFLGNGYTSGSYAFANVHYCYDRNSEMPAFGGMYNEGSELVNPPTQGFNCPPGMQAISYPQGVTVCLSSDPTATSYYFGGFYIDVSTGECVANMNGLNSGCGCPSIAPTSFLMYESDVSSLVIKLYACIGSTVQYLHPNNTGVIIPLNVMAAQSYNMTNRYCDLSRNNGDNYVYAAIIVLTGIVIASLVVSAAITIIYIKRRKIAPRELYAQL